VQYVVQHRLGRGGSGVVDLALDPQGRPVALKRLALHGSAHDLERARRRVHREAETLRRLDHPAIVGLLDVVDDGDDLVLVMPYLSGGTLGDHVRARGPLHPDQVGTLADRLLDGLAAAHRLGIVHRDLKPGNVLFDGFGQAYLADFGMASLRDATSGLTATGMIVGTPEFMAPEQARGEPATPASDVFSLGATLLFAASGQPPYGRGDPRVVLALAARGRVAPIPPSVDRDTRHRILPMLRRDPRRRPTAAEVAGGPAGTQVRAGPRRVLPVAAMAAAAVALLGVGATLAVALRGDGRSDAAAPPPVPVSTAPPCTPLPYQPCGAPPAPFTDGVRCVADHADYDGDPANGCEAAPDDLDGTPLRSTIEANLVPSGDVDRYPTRVDDTFDLFCDGVFTVALTAPAGTSMRLDLLDGDTVLDTAVSRDAGRVAITLGEPGCFTDDSTELTTRVSWVGDARSAEPYLLERRGSF
jgi:hypothetical protein